MLVFSKKAELSFLDGIIYKIKYIDCVYLCGWEL